MIDNFLFAFSVIGYFRIFMYSIGDPHSEEFNPRAIFAWYSQSIAELRAYQIGIILPEHYSNDNSKSGKILQKIMKIESDVLSVRSYGGWIQMVGFCSTCTSVWALTPIIFECGIGYYLVSLLISRFVFKYL